MKDLSVGLFIVSILFAFAGCKDKTIPQENIKVEIPRFDSQNAYDNVEKLVDFGPRLVGTEGHQQARDWMAETLKIYGLQVQMQNFNAELYDGRKVKGTNVVARHNPNVQERILLGAHWDTRHIAEKDTIRKDQPILGADDGASGPAVLLEIARLLSENSIPMGVDIVFFDLEDHGDPNGSSPDTWGIGSQHWAKKAKAEGYSAKYSIVLSMVGAQNARWPIEGYTASSAAKISDKIWDLAIGMGRSRYFEKVRTEAITDDHRFIFEILGLPVIYISNRPKENTFAYYHHTHADNLSVISKETLGAVGQVLTAVIYHESNKTL